MFLNERKKNEIINSSDASEQISIVSVLENKLDRFPYKYFLPIPTFAGKAVSQSFELYTARSST
jgi:hypothetical protein